MKVLIASTRELCYMSGSFFLDRIQGSLENAGVEVVRLDFIGNKADFSALEPFVGESFDAIIDMNSVLPYLINDKEERILDAIDGPFINYIMDHPLYHHPGLQFPLKNYYAVGLDHRHAEYMQKYYPHLKAVKVLPMAGTRAVSRVPFEKRNREILFLGTYVQDDIVENKILELRRQINNATYETARDLYEDWNEQKETIEEALEKLLRGYSGAATAQEMDFYIQDVYELAGFSELLNHMFLVDQRKRNEKRLRVLKRVAEEYPLKVVGEGWDRTELRDTSNVCLVQGCAMSHSFEVMARHQVILDINPMFFDGLHDRVTSALANGCVCVTDMAESFDKKLQNENNIMFYKEKNLERVLEALNEKSTEELHEIAKAGEKWWADNYSWSCHANKLLQFINEISKNNNT